MAPSQTVLDLFFKSLSFTEKKLQEKIIEVSSIESLAPNEWVIKQGQYINWLVFVLNGNVRVWQEHELKEISLYYVRPYQTCVLSLAATLRDCKSSVFAKTTEPTGVLRIPVRHIAASFFQFKSWNRFALNTFINSYETLLEDYSTLAFKTIPERLMDYLYNEVKAQNSTELHLTHQALANEIGTSREVVSRTLKQFEDTGLIERSFKKIRVVT